MFRKQLLAVVVVTAATASNFTIAGNGNDASHKQLPDAYCLYDIGRLPGLPPGVTSISVTDINNRNQAIGWTTLSGGSIPLHAFIWDRTNGMRDLGQLPALPATFPSGINDAGTIVGDANNTDTGEDRAIIWPGGVGPQLLDISLGGRDSSATDINRSGQIAGFSELSMTSDLGHAVLRETSGDVLDLGAFPEGDGFSFAAALNNRGQVVGGSNGSFSTEAFIWDKRRGMRRLLESPGRVATLPADINDHGEVVGERLFEGTRAFRWTRQDGMQDLGALSGVDTDFSTAKGINRWGHIVGGSQFETDGLVHGFIWTQKSGMLDLNDRIHPTSPLANVLVVGGAAAINDSGWIVGDGFIPDAPDPQRSYVLVPRRAGEEPCS